MVKIKLNRSRAFSLMELLVVASIITIIGGIAFPTLSALGRESRRSSTINTIGVAVAAARAYAMREISFAADLNPGVAGDQTSPDGYSGAALIFTPQGELRLVENSQLARDASAGLGNSLELADRNGYSDLSTVDYLKLPKGYGVVGIIRNATGDSGLLLLTAPFAIRFDEYGHIVAGRPSSSDKMVYYDSNYDGRYQTSSSRPLFYNVEQWDPESSKYDPGDSDSKAGIHETSKRHKLPWEEIESVVGVMLYSKRDMVNAGVDLFWAKDFVTGIERINDSGMQWLLETGEPLYFSRTTGTMMRGNL